eukprot:gene25487-11145_t
MKVEGATNVERIMMDRLSVAQEAVNKLQLLRMKTESEPRDALLSAYNGMVRLLQQEEAEVARLSLEASDAAAAAARGGGGGVAQFRVLKTRLLLLLLSGTAKRDGGGAAQFEAVEAQLPLLAPAEGGEVAAKEVEQEEEGSPASTEAPAKGVEAAAKEGGQEGEAEAPAEGVEAAAKEGGQEGEGGAATSEALAAAAAAAADAAESAVIHLEFLYAQLRSFARTFRVESTDAGMAAALQQDILDSPGVSERCKQELEAMLHLRLQGGPTATGLARGGEAKEEAMADEVGEGAEEAVVEEVMAEGEADVDAVDYDVSPPKDPVPGRNQCHGYAVAASARDLQIHCTATAYLASYDQSQACCPPRLAISPPV